MVEMPEKARVVAQTAVVTPAPDEASDAKRVVDLALPAVGEQMLNMTVGMVDTFWWATWARRRWPASA